MLALIFAYLLGGGLIAGQNDAQAAQTGTGTQVLGSFRAIPQIALWGRIREAEDRGNWHGMAALFDLLSELTPNSATVPVYQARTEALAIGAQLSERDDQLAWIRRGLLRLTAARNRSASPAVLDEGIWTVGNYAGEEFPAEVAALLWADLGEARSAGAANELAGAILATPAAVQFLRDGGLAADTTEDGMAVPYWQGSQFAALPEEAQGLLDAADQSLQQALRRVAERGLGSLTGARPRLLFEYGHSLIRLARWESAEGRQSLQDAFTAAVKAEERRQERAGTPETRRTVKELAQRWAGTQARVDTDGQN